MSFRVPEDLAEAIETEANVNNVNPSTLLTQILVHHIGFEGNMGKAGLVSFPRPLLVKLMEGYPENKVIAIADYISKDTITDIMTVLQNEYTVDSFLNLIESWSNASKIPFRRLLKGNLNTCIIQHDMGKNWSLFLGNLYKNVIEELTQKKVSINTTDNTVKFMF
ncbi:MAG: hypothetical protein KGI25_08455 [Thaumarchaeota archaeon]|nr:hypothetical protein [Nitrososphaerota archaeon]